MGSKPLVVIDARMVEDQDHGIGRFVEELAESFKITKIEWEQKFEIHFLISNHLHRGSGVREFSYTLCESNFLNPMAWIEIPMILKKLKADLYHNPSFEAFLKLPCPYVATVHDLNHLHFGSASKRLYYKYVLKPFLKRARKVLTVSHAMKDDIANWLNVSKEEIAVTPNFVQVPSMLEPEMDYVLKQWNLKPKEFFLAIGNPKPHKNMPFLIRAFQRAKTEFPLMVTLSEKDMSMTYSKVKGIGTLPSRELYALLAQARALLFPTLYEGYGRPPVEAVLLGTPLIVSDIPVLKESLKNAEGGVIFCTPGDEAAWIQAIELVSRDTSQPTSFSKPPSDLDVFARLHTQVYDSVLGKKNQ